jgi:NAD(P)-dependent dehydrogenase (short-subunit alcohol dehydrogenase family)
MSTGRREGAQAVAWGGRNAASAPMEDRVAIVTGAGQGIGFGIAEALCHAGASVVIGELEEEKGKEAAETLGEQGYEAEFVPLDVTKGESCSGLVEGVLARHGQIDVLVNNAGLFRMYRSEEMPESEWRIQIDVMLTGVFLCTQAVARPMIARRAGSVVNIASIGGMGGWPMRSAYNAAKAGVIALTEVLAVEWAQHKIRLNCVSPGVTRTEMVASAVAEGVADLGQYSARTPLGRLAEVREVANAVLFLASDRATYVTGQNLRVDGGWVPYGNPHGIGFPEGEADA